MSAADLSTPTIFGGTGVDPFEMVIVGNRLYLANQGSNTVTVYDTATTAAVKTITVGARPTGLVVSPDETKVYVTNAFSNSVSVIETVGIPSRRPSPSVLSRLP